MLFSLKNSNPFKYSKILNDESSSKDLIKLCEFPVHQKWQLVYRATDHGFGFKDFHAKCSGQNRCLTIVKSESGNIFGGYTDGAWSKSLLFIK